MSGGDGAASSQSVTVLTVFGECRAPTARARRPAAPRGALQTSRPRARPPPAVCGVTLAVLGALWMLNRTPAGNELHDEL